MVYDNQLAEKAPWAITDRKSLLWDVRPYEYDAINAAVLGR